MNDLRSVALNLFALAGIVRLDHERAHRQFDRARAMLAEMDSILDQINARRDEQDQGDGDSYDGWLPPSDRYHKED